MSGRDLPPDVAGPGRAALAVGLAGAAASLLLGWADPAQFFRSYLVAFAYWLAIPLGCSALGMLHHLSRGAWGLPIRRVFEAAARTLPIAALLFAPLLFGLEHLYHWARPGEAAADPVLRHQAAWLNVPFFVARAGLYFAAWCLLAWSLDRLSRRQDETGDPGLVRSMQVRSAPGLVLYGVTATLAAVDWFMSLDSHWFSTIYGFTFIGGQALSALAFVIVVAGWLAGRPPMSEVLGPAVLRDHGNLLLTFVMLWAYFNASQLIIVWEGNLPEEAGWYTVRLHGAWMPLTLALAVLHFAVPFLLLLSRDLKRRGRVLASIAGALLAVRFLDFHWLAAPIFSPDRLTLHWLDLSTTAAIGGLWIAGFLRELRRRPLLPRRDPDFAAVPQHG